MIIIPVLTLRQAALWNLRQLGLIAPFPTVEEGVRNLVAVQAQNFREARDALALRTEQVEQVRDNHLLYPNGEIVRIWTVRGTLHLVPADEAAIHQVATSEDWFSRWGRFLDRRLPVSRAKLIPELYQQIAEVLQEGPLNYGQIVERVYLAEPYKRLLPHLMKDLCFLGFCVRGPQDGRAATYYGANYPLYPGLQRREAQAKLLKRYIRRYGPISLGDLAYWSGLRLSDVKKIMPSISGELLTVRLEGQADQAFIYKEQLEMLLAQPLNIVLPTHHLPAFDVLLLAYKDKSRFLAKENIKKVFLSAARVCPILLKDGRVVGTWRRKQEESVAELF